MRQPSGPFFKSTRRTQSSHVGQDEHLCSVQPTAQLSQAWVESTQGPVKMDMFLRKVHRVENSSYELLERSIISKSSSVTNKSVEFCEDSSHWSLVPIRHCRSSSESDIYLQVSKESSLESSESLESVQTLSQVSREPSKASLESIVSVQALSQVSRESSKASSESLESVQALSQFSRESSQASLESFQSGQPSSHASRESSQISTELLKPSESSQASQGESSKPSSSPGSPSSGYHSGRASSEHTFTSDVTRGNGEINECWGPNKNEGKILIRRRSDSELWSQDRNKKEVWNENETWSHSDTESEKEIWWSESSGEVWCEGEWPLDRALPLPRWGCPRPDLGFDTLQEFDAFLACLTPHLQYTLSNHCYDTVSNFITFCESYQSWTARESGDLDQFYRDYEPLLVPGRHTCVGLTCLLQSRLSELEKHYPGFKDATYKVSCEEEVDNVEWYCEGAVPPYTCEKEHVLVCLRVRVEGRSGVVLLDPGYHVGTPVVVMDDGAVPQSGSICGSSARPGTTRTFQYRSWPDNPGYITWEVTIQPQDGPTKHHVSLIHVARPFLSHMDVAERRNLAYPFKSLIARGPDGKLTCGLYFPLCYRNQAHVTLFSQSTRCKVPLSYFLNADRDMSVEALVAAVGSGTRRGEGELHQTLTQVAKLLSNDSLLMQLDMLNKAIDLISIEN